jgi:3-oxoacyl-[acyl-carrier protein] reductase
MLMDLGLADRKALICGASQGLGYACAMALAQEGARVTLLYVAVASHGKKIVP